jgi:CRP/FNR family cyclic AMP-dependent transcriptional regulator
MNISTTEQILQNPVFVGLEIEEAEELARHCEVMVLEEGCQIFAQGEFSEDMYVLFQGQLVLKVRDIIGEEMEVGFLEQGEIFGEMGVLEQYPRSASVYANNNSVVLRIPGEGFHAMIDAGHSAIHLLLASTLKQACSRLRELDRRLDALFRADQERNRDSNER